MATGGPNTGILAETINPALKGNWVYSDLPQINLSRQPAADLHRLQHLCRQHRLR